MQRNAFVRLGGFFQKAILMVNNKVYPIFEGLNTIGRSKTATVIIKNPVSMCIKVLCSS